MTTDIYYPYLLRFVAPGVYTFRALPKHRRGDLVQYAARLVAASFTTHAVVFAPDECFEIPPNGEPKFTLVPTPAIAFREDVLRPEELPLGAREAEPTEGVEIYADMDRRRVWTAEYVQKRRTWRIVRHQINKNGEQIRRRVYEGNARGLYLYAEEIGADIDRMQEELPGLPTPWQTYDDEVEELVKGTRIRCDEGQCCYWRNNRGWWFRLIGDGTGYHPLEPPVCDDYGPFRNREKLQEAMAERGVA